MRFLLEPDRALDLDELERAGTAARAAGLDGVLLAPSASLPAPLVALAALAARVDEILLAARIPLGDRHPLELAEEAVVVDLASGGRLVLAVEPASGNEADFPEALALLRTAFAPRPFRFEGRRWAVPARLPGNVHNIGESVRLTPAPARPRLEVWGAGAGVQEASASGLGCLADADATSHQLRHLRQVALERCGGGALTAPWARHECWANAAALIERLRDGRAAFAQDWAVVRAPIEAAIEIGSCVRPRLQLDVLPPGLEEHWELGDAL